MSLNLISLLSSSSEMTVAVMLAVVVLLELLAQDEVDNDWL